MTLGIHRRTARLRSNGLPSARALSRAILLAAGALVLASCGESASSANKRQVKSAAGAIATAQMALVAWLADAAPTDYARRTVKAMRTICIIFLVEMAGRFAAVSHHTI